MTKHFKLKANSPRSLEVYGDSGQVYTFTKDTPAQVSNDLDIAQFTKDRRLVEVTVENEEVPQPEPTEDKSLRRKGKAAPPQPETPAEPETPSGE